MPSLKHFHILFVSISIIFCLFFAYWSYTESFMIYFSLAIISMVSLIIYGKAFYNKLKSIQI